MGDASVFEKKTSGNRSKVTSSFAEGPLDYSTDHFIRASEEGIWIFSQTIGFIDFSLVSFPSYHSSRIISGRQAIKK